MHTEATKKLFTVDEYYRMGEAGILAEDDRVELIEGEIIQMSPIGPKQAAAVDRVSKLFFALALKDKTNVRVQSPMGLGEYNEPVPDITLLAARADFYAMHHPAAADVLLAIEVADTSLRYDRDVKIPIYAARGVSESWIEDLNGDVILVFRDPAPEGYKTCLTLRRGDSIRPLAFSDFVISVDDLLG